MNQSNIMSISAIRKKTGQTNQPPTKNLSKEHRFQGCHGSMVTSSLINLSQVGGDKSTLMHFQRVSVSSPLKMDGWKMKCPFGARPIFRGYVKFPGCIKKWPLVSINFTPKHSHCCLKKWYTMVSRYLSVKREKKLLGYSKPLTRLFRGKPATLSGFFSIIS